MKKEDFTVDKVESALRRNFGDKSKKEVGLMDKTHTVAVNNLNCPTKLADRDPNRVGGPLFRTDIKTAPGAKKVKRANNTAINTIKAVVSDGQQRLNEGGNTLLEACVEDEAMDDIESLDPALHEGFEDNGKSAQTLTAFPQSTEGIEEEVQAEL
ncbi:hypothetical protein PI124_g1311 [Phytophthora idaei]|nr:hypothetical protein PI126_g829 [Phytophthora idaei]KAG3254146.1 hypothetical protein PI124_g1311 [Phytophthora idaei]